MYYLPLGCRSNHHCISHSDDQYIPFGNPCTWIPYLYPVRIWWRTGSACWGLRDTCMSCNHQVVCLLPDRKNRPCKAHSLFLE